MPENQDRPDTQLLVSLLCICYETQRIVNHLQAVSPENKSKLKRLQGEDSKIGANPKEWIRMWIKVTRERLDNIEQLLAIVWEDKEQEEKDESESS